MFEKYYLKVFNRCAGLYFSFPFFFKDFWDSLTGIQLSRRPLEPARRGRPYKSMSDVYEIWFSLSLLFHVLIPLINLLGAARPPRNLIMVIFKLLVRAFAFFYYYYLNHIQFFLVWQLRDVNSVFTLTPRIFKKWFLLTRKKMELKKFTW